MTSPALTVMATAIWRLTRKCGLIYRCSVQVCPSRVESSQFTEPSSVSCDLSSVASPGCKHDQSAETQNKMVHQSCSYKLCFKNGHRILHITKERHKEWRTRQPNLVESSPLIINYFVKHHMVVTSEVVRAWGTGLATCRPNCQVK